MKFTGIPGIPGERELYFEHKFRWPAPWEEGRRRGEEVTTALTCRSSRILVSSFGRAARSKAGTGSTFARQSEKRAKYGRKRGAPFLLPTPLLFPSPHSTPLLPSPPLPSLSAVSNEEMPGGGLSIRNVSFLSLLIREIQKFSPSGIRFDSCSPLFSKYYFFSRN